MSDVNNGERETCDELLNKLKKFLQDPWGTTHHLAADQNVNKQIHKSLLIHVENILKVDDRSSRLKYLIFCLVRCRFKTILLK